MVLNVQVENISIWVDTDGKDKLMLPNRDGVRHALPVQNGTDRLAVYADIDDRTGIAGHIAFRPIDGNLLFENLFCRRLGLYQLYFGWNRFSAFQAEFAVIRDFCSAVDAKHEGTLLILYFFLS